MISFKEYFYLKEDPDTVDGHYSSVAIDRDEKIFAEYTDDDAYAFLIFKANLGHVFCCGDPAEAHYELYESIVENDGSFHVYPEISDHNFDMLLPKIKQGYGIHDKSKILGRLWTGQRVISFWQEKPIVLKYKDLILGFMREFGENPEDYLFQFIESDDLIKYSDLFGKLAQTKSREEIEAKKRAHLDSPLDKKDTNRVPMTAPEGKLKRPRPGMKWWAPTSESTKQFKDRHV